MMASNYANRENLNTFVHDNPVESDMFYNKSQ